MRRNVAALRSKANLTQQGLADEMLLRGIAWTRETVAQVETTNRRLGFTEAVVVAACLDVPLARLAATGVDDRRGRRQRVDAAYLGAAIAGTAGDVFPPESYCVGSSRRVGAVRGTDGPPRRSSRPVPRRGGRAADAVPVSAGQATSRRRCPADAARPTPAHRRRRRRPSGSNADSGCG